ncbi:ER membrane protein complex subunit 8 [Elysia marginata]|uniref:ER membrane protein complex subunit 8 n=1 Tax=Elysia marginata TaxID=1093978 RepID=A0AAV4FGY2_9GAST|nr:ER membrane protein complex subunit 8 [Elysia marginata]
MARSQSHSLAHSVPSVTLVCLYNLFQSVPSVTLVETYCKGKNLVIAGYYQANENYSDNELNHVARTIGRKVQENFQDACLLMVDNRKVKVESVSQPYKIYTLRESGWKDSDRKNLSEDSISKEECLYALLKSGSQRQLCDFDNHFDDVKNDWRNLELNDLISRCT